MKSSLLLIPDAYSIKNVVVGGLSKLGYNVQVVDFRKNVSNSKYYTKLNKILHKERASFDRLQLMVNKFFIKEFNKNKPEIVFIYNEELVLPDTILWFKSRSKVIYLLGDDPLNLNPPNRYNLSNLFLADRVVCADSTWKTKLERIGLTNIIYDYVAYDPTSFVIDNKSEILKRDNDLLFVGRSYIGSWGYKRCLFLNEFSTLNINIHGTGAHWGNWVETFPNIALKLIDHKKKVPFEFLNKLMHSHKIFPIDANPGIVSGLHLRVFECISAGILPLVEYTDDIDIVFEGIPLPVIKYYSESKGLAEELLNNNEKRIDILHQTREYLNDNYSPERVMMRVIENL